MRPSRKLIAQLPPPFLLGMLLLFSACGTGSTITTPQKAPASQQDILPMLAEIHRRRPQPTGYEGVPTVKVRAPANTPQIERIGDASTRLADVRAHIQGFGKRIGRRNRQTAAHAPGQVSLKTVIGAAEVVSERPTNGRENARLEEDAVIKVVGVGNGVLQARHRVINRPRDKARRVKVADIVELDSDVSNVAQFKHGAGRDLPLDR